MCLAWLQSVVAVISTVLHVNHINVGAQFHVRIISRAGISVFFNMQEGDGKEMSIKGQQRPRDGFIEVEVEPD